MSLSFAYYPGCSQVASSAEYDASVRSVCRALGIELADIPDWTCCGSTPAHNIDPRLSAALSARNLVQAKNAGQVRITTPCPSCLANLRNADHKMENPEFADKVNRLLDEPYTGGMTATSFLQVVFENIGPERLAKEVVSPLNGLKVAVYYGCLTTRPAGLMAFDDEENPTSMDKLMEACGAKAVEFPFKTECCGASMATSCRDAVPTLGGRILELAKGAGAQAVVVACPLCQLNLDMRRSQITAKSGEGNPLPVFYFTQLIGLALGRPESELGLDKLCVSPAAALRAIRTPAAPAPAAKTTKTDKEPQPCA